MPKRHGPGIELLADPTRRRIIAFLALRPQRPSVVAAEIGLSRAATSRQLHLLQDAGLIEVRRPYHDRRSRMYAIDLQARGRIIAWLAGTEIGRPTDPEIDEPKPPTVAPPTLNFGPPPEARAPIDYDDPAALDDLLDF
jgi:DNA-binding transcriptional ArsR family regulator